MEARAAVQIKVNERIYLRDPEQTELGKKIVSVGIVLIDEIGFEQFTFKKLAERIGSTEASIYRYFENKHKLLTYLVAWYWTWLEYRFSFHTNNITDPREKLKIAIKILADSINYDPSYSHIDESLLYRIVVAESDKTYLTKDVDQENREGFFLAYKSLCKRIAAVILEIESDFQYAHALTSTMIEAAHQQVFFSKHLPSLTEVKVEKGGNEEVADFLEYIVFRLLKK